jgi:hypothetical protein
LFRTIILAEVAATGGEPARYVLRRVGIGLGVPDSAGGEIVVDSDRLAQLGVRLGMMEKVVLQAAEAELAKGGMVMATPTFALFRGPATLRVGDSHQVVEMAYAFLVDPERGGLRVLAWPQRPRGEGAAVLAMPVELRPNLVFDCQLDVKAKRLLGAIPTSWSFAMKNLPPGKPRPISPALAAYLADDARPRDPLRTEQALRKALTVRRQQEVQQASGS